MFCYEGNSEKVVLTQKEVEKLVDVEKRVPEPRFIIVNGIIDQLTYSKRKVKIKTEKGIMEGFFSEIVEPDKIASFWGKEATITGKLHYKPNGKTIVEIDDVVEPSEEDKFFSKKYEHKTVEDQFMEQVQKKGNRLHKVVGKWPGNEDFDDLLKLLKE